MNEEDRKVLESLGWTSKLLESADAASTMNATDQIFLKHAQSAFAEAAVSALEFLAENPGLSKIELAQRLNRGVSAIGMIMAIYDEAAKRGKVRETTRDLLTRELRAAFPRGWSSTGNIHPLVKIGTFSEVGKYAHEPKFADYMRPIMQHLTIDNPPFEGWRPEPENDPLINELFNRYWPIDATNHNRGDVADK